MGRTTNEDLVDGIEARPFLHHGRPAMALILRLPLRVGRLGSVPFTVVLVEDDDGQPRTGLVPADFVERGMLSEALIESEGWLGLGRSWFEGSRAWAMLCERDGGETPGLRLLDRRVQARSAELIAEALPRCEFTAEFLEGLRCLNLMQVLSYDWLGKLFERSPTGAAVRRFVAAHPLLATIHFQGVVRLAEKGPVDILAFAPNLGRARIARIESRAWDGAVVPMQLAMMADSGANEFLDFIGGLPVEWIPTTKRQVGAMLSVIALGYPLLRARVSSGAFSRSCAGDWIGFLGRCRTASGQRRMFDRWGTSRLDSFIMDPVADFSVRVVFPIMRMRGIVVAEREARLPERLALRILYRDKSLPGCLEAARVWHRRLPAINAAMPVEEDGGVPWPALFDPVEVDGVVLQPLLTSAEVVAEGCRGRDGSGIQGLDHCIASYRNEARSGRTHLVSLRRMSRSGRFVRLATAEIRQEPDGRLDLIQLQGRANGPCPPAAFAAMQAFLKATPRLPFIPTRESSTGDILRDACGYDCNDPGNVRMAASAYDSMLPRSLRGDFDALGAIIEDTWDALVSEGGTAP